MDFDREHGRSGPTTDLFSASIAGTHGKGALVDGLGRGEACIHFREIGIICYQFPLVTCGTEVDELNEREPSVLALYRHKNTMCAASTPVAEQELQA